MTATGPKVAFLMADYGHDPTETALPFEAFKRAGFTTTFITESGAVPKCDDRMLTGWTGTLLGCSAAASSAYTTMSQSPEWLHPRSWSDASLSLDPYDLLFLPGGHEAGVRQLLDSGRAQALVAAFWAGTSARDGTKCVAAVCHGVQLLAHTRTITPGGSNKSVLHDVRTTALTSSMENAAYWATRLVLGDYYKTYGAGTPNVEAVVRAALDDPGKQFVGALNPASPLVVQDEARNYVSGRWPGDVPALAEAAVAMVRRVQQQQQKTG